MSTEVRAPMVGKLLSIRVETGQKINEEDEMFVLEAMKMEIPIYSPATGTVKEIKIAAGEAVEAEQLLATIE